MKLIYTFIMMFVFAGCGDEGDRIPYQDEVSEYVAINDGIVDCSSFHCPEDNLIHTSGKYEIKYCSDEVLERETSYDPLYEVDKITGWCPINYEGPLALISNGEVIIIEFQFDTEQLSIVCTDGYSEEYNIQ